MVVEETLRVMSAAARLADEDETRIEEDDSDTVITSQEEPRRDAVEGNAVERLLSFTDDACHNSFDRGRFEILLEEARKHLQAMNFEKVTGEGYLLEEGRRLKGLFDTMPRIAGYGVLLLVSGVEVALLFTSDILTPPAETALNASPLNEAPFGDLLTPLLTSIAIALAVALATVIINQALWFYKFERRNEGVTRARNIRLKNHHILSTRILHEQHVASRNARNKDPDTGADGLLRVYLLFICGFILHRTVTRSRRYFTMYWKDELRSDVETRLNGWRSAAFAAFVILAALAAAHLLSGISFEDLLLQTDIKIVALSALAILASWLVQQILFSTAMRPKGRIHRHYEFMLTLYEPFLPSTSLAKLDEDESERNRYDFPALYAFHDIEEYAPWLYETLTALKKHEDETRR